MKNTTNAAIAASSNRVTASPQLLKRASRQAAKEGSTLSAWLDDAVVSGLAPHRRTSIDLDVEVVARLRAILRATGEGSLEPFLNGFLKSLVDDEPMTGCLMENVPSSKKPSAKAKIARILAGDRRLVHREPLPKTLYVDLSTMTRLRQAADQSNCPASSIADLFLGRMLDGYEAGTVKLIPTPLEG